MVNGKVGSTCEFWFRLVPVGSGWLRLVPVGFGWFRLVSVGPECRRTVVRKCIWIVSFGGTTQGMSQTLGCKASVVCCVPSICTADSTSSLVGGDLYVVGGEWINRRDRS